MSFRVNTNVNAMNAMRNLDANSAEFSKSITRLSTGLRINSAADDPAGLIISEKFRAQISGLGQAITISQDAINYAKTAEGAFGEVNTLLDRRSERWLLQALTQRLSPVTVLQLTRLSSTVSSTSITRIASTTQYGSKKLLDGSSGTTSAVTAGTVTSVH